MAQSSKTKMKKPNAMFEFVVSGESEDKEDQKKVRMEFNHEELFEFYNQVWKHLKTIFLLHGL